MDHEENTITFKPMLVSDFKIKHFDYSTLDDSLLVELCHFAVTSHCLTNLQRRHLLLIGKFKCEAEQ